MDPTKPGHRLTERPTPVRLPAPMAELTLTVHRTHGLSDGGTALEARTPDGQLVTLWEGSPNHRSKCDHLGLADPLFDGLHDGQPVWIESRPGLWLLSDLPASLDAATALWLGSRLADALARLHSLDRAHGWVGSETVALQSDGAPCLIGVGRVDGTPQDDLRAAIDLIQRLHPFNVLPTESGSASSLAASLRELALEQPNEPVDLAALLMEQGRPQQANPRSLTIHVTPLGMSDEVQPDLGSDATGRGLLDRWAPLEGSGEITVDPTETAEFALADSQVHHDLLGRIQGALNRAAARQEDAFSPPGAHFRSHLIHEPLDPLPISNGLHHGALHNPDDHAEQTAERSVPEATNPSLLPIEETASGTGETADTDALTIQPSVITGLLWATVVGMVAAAVMLLAVWAIISGVF